MLPHKGVMTLRVRINPHDYGPSVRMGSQLLSAIAVGVFPWHKKCVYGTVEDPSICIPGGRVSPVHIAVSNRMKLEERAQRPVICLDCQFR